MVRGKGKVAEPTELLSQTEREGLLDEKKDLQSQLSEAQEAGSGSSRAGSVDTIMIQRKIRQIENAVNTGTPEEARGKLKDNLIREERDIEDRLVIGMPTRYEMDFPHKCPGAVRKHMAWDARNKKLIERYVEIQKIIRPEEPNSIEALRKDK